MKFYASVDMEGIAGVVLREQLVKGEILYEETRRILTSEVNAVVDKLVDLGAKEIIVKDAHGRGFNFVVEDLHEQARYVLGASRMDNRFPGIDNSFDGALLIGYHAMAGTRQAVRDHTMVANDWQSIELNGAPIGEIGLDALLFGLYDVPVIFVSGDRTACQEAQRDLTYVTTYETKVAVGRHAALVKSPKTVRREIQQSIEEAVFKKGQCIAYKKSGPFELKMSFASTDLADARNYDGITSFRLDGISAMYRDNDLVRLLAKSM